MEFAFWTSVGYPRDERIVRHLGILDSRTATTPKWVVDRNHDFATLDGHLQARSRRRLRSPPEVWDISSPDHDCRLCSGVHSQARRRARHRIRDHHRLGITRAIESFAGEDAEAAVVPLVAQSMMVEFDARARHYEVVLTNPW